MYLVRKGMDMSNLFSIFLLNTLVMKKALSISEFRNKFRTEEDWVHPKFSQL